MTLIAHVNFKSLFMFVGDMLLSNSVENHEVIDIPAFADVNSILPDGIGLSISGMRQKLNIFNDRLLIGWAGNYMQARSMINDIVWAVEDGETSSDEILKIIEDTPDGDKNDLALIGMFLPDPNKPYFAPFNFYHDVTERKGIDWSATAAGSGDTEIFRVIPELMAGNPAPIGNNVDNHEIICHWALNQLQLLSAKLVGHETAHGSNLVAGWGGAIETVYIEDRKFKKCSNILHVSFGAKKIESNLYGLYLLPKLIKYDYFEDIFMIQTVNFEEDHKAKALRVVDHKTLGYTPMFKTREHYNFEKYVPQGLNHNTLCIHIFIDPPHPNGDLVSLHRRADGDSHFNAVADKDGTIRISIHDMLKQSLATSVTNLTGILAEFK